MSELQSMQLPMWKPGETFISWLSRVATYSRPVRLSSKLRIPTGTEMLPIECPLINDDPAKTRDLKPD